MGTVEAYVKDKPTHSSSSEHLNVAELDANFTVPSDFGISGAILFTNSYSKEFYEFDKLYIDGSNVKDVNHTDREYYLRKYIKKVLSIKDKLLKDAATHCPRLIVKG